MGCLDLVTPFFLPGGGGGGLFGLIVSRLCDLLEVSRGGGELASGLAAEDFLLGGESWVIKENTIQNDLPDSG